MHKKTVGIICVFSTLLFGGIYLGLVSLYFGAAYYRMPMFISYFKAPLLPLLNILPVLFCMLLIYFVTNRVWVSFLVTSAVTVTFTLINYFKLMFRNDPLLAADLSLLSESMRMAGEYDIRLSWKIIGIIIVCILGTIAASLFARGKIRSVRIRLAGTAILIFTGIFCFNGVYMDSGVYASTQNYSLINKWSGTQVYISKGFIYPFIYSIKSNIDRPPAGYDEKSAKTRLYAYDHSDIPDGRKVNIISVMLEAYNDFSKFKQIGFETDVYGYLRQLEAESYTGSLVTNVFAGGTIDTERCFLTGYTSLTNFRSNTNSYVRYLAGQGYAVEGSHPCYAWFYNRKNVNEYLGFENYYFFEDCYSELANGQIAKDDILFPQIQKLFEANKKTGKPYFSFNVTYQNHGPYPSHKLTDVRYIKDKGYTEEEYNILNNYFSGIHSTNQELKKLVEYFRSEEEPVVLILFGDHNPWMGDGNSIYAKLGIDFDMSAEEGFYNYYNVPYIIWGNESAKMILGNQLKGKGPDIGPYFLMNEFFKLAGYEGNEFMKLSNELKAVVDVVHTKERYKESGILTSELTDPSAQKLSEFLQVQYYWRRHFTANSQY